MVKTIYRLLPLMFGAFLASCEEKVNKVELKDKGDDFGETIHHDPTIFRVGDAWELDGKELTKGKSIGDAMRATGKTVFHIQATDAMPAKHLNELLYAIDGKQVKFYIMDSDREHASHTLVVMSESEASKVEIEPMLVEVQPSNHTCKVIINKEEGLSDEELRERFYTYKENCQSSGKTPTIELSFDDEATHEDVLHVLRAYNIWGDKSNLTLRNRAK